LAEVLELAHHFSPHFIEIFLNVILLNLNTSIDGSLHLLHVGLDILDSSVKIFRCGFDLFQDDIICFFDAFVETCVLLLDGFHDCVSFAIDFFFESSV